MTELIDQQVTGTEVAGLFNPAAEDTLTGEERVILASLLTRDDRVDLAIPDAMDARDLWQTLDICSRVFLRVRHASGQLKLLIGRALAVIQNNPEVYESRGFSSFDEFMSDESRGLPKITGISRAELYKAKSVALAVGPGMNLEDARQIGFSKMQLIASVTDPGSSTQQSLIESAKLDTMPQLRERIARSNMNVQVGDMEWDTLLVQMTKTQKRIAQEFFTNPQVQAYCDTSSAGMILERAIQECQSEWQIGQIITDRIAAEAADR